MLNITRRIGIAAAAAIGIAFASAGPADAAWHHWRHHHHGWWGGPRVFVGGAYAYDDGGCFVRKHVRINRWGERVVRRVTVCR
jgi:hypothetical protein